MKKEKTEKQDNKKCRQICDKCKQPTPDTAAMMYRGRITWLCYKCYQAEKKGKDR